MLSAVLVLAALGITLIVTQNQSAGARKRTGSALVPVRIRVQRPALERRRVR